MVRSSAIRSILLHTLLILVAAGLMRDTTRSSSISTSDVRIIEIVRTDVQPSALSKRLRSSGRGKLLPDIRPAYMKSGWMTKSLSAKPAIERKESSTGTSYAEKLLSQNSRSITAFDQLALQIHYYLDYPSLLIENGVEGYSTLDLYFDSEGEIDEARSGFSGSHRLVRGLLARAARRGIEKWYLSDGGRLEREQFRNQHFRADFSISRTQTSDSRVEKNGEDSYRIVRRHHASLCATPFGVDLACIAVKGYGAVKNAITDESRVRFIALRDTLDHYDEIGLSGLREVVRRGRT